MPLWRNIRRLDTSGPVQGVVNPGPADVVTPLQAVQIVDDASHAVAPVATTEGFVTDTGNISLGEHSGLQFNAAAGGLWLRAAFPNAAAISFNLFRDVPGTQAVDSSVAAARVARTHGFAFESGLFDVQVLTAAVPASPVVLVVGGFISSLLLDLFIPPGEHWFALSVGANAALGVTFRISEVPTSTRNA